MSFRKWLFGPISWHLSILERKVDEMAAREDAARARQAELLELVKAAMVAKDHEIEALKHELSNADANAQARVDEALANDSEHDADAIEEGNHALEELLNPTQPTDPGTEPETPTEEEPEVPTGPTPEEDPNLPEVEPIEDEDVDPDADPDAAQG